MGCLQARLRVGLGIEGTTAANILMRGEHGQRKRPRSASTPPLSLQYTRIN
jgi:hypothetical protein